MLQCCVVFPIGSILYAAPGRQRGLIGHWTIAMVPMPNDDDDGEDRTKSCTKALALVLHTRRQYFLSSPRTTKNNNESEAYASRASQHQGSQLKYIVVLVHNHRYKSV